MLVFQILSPIKPKWVQHLQWNEFSCLWWTLWICAIRTESNLGNRSEADAGCIGAEAPSSLRGLVKQSPVAVLVMLQFPVWTKVKNKEGYATSGITSTFLSSFLHTFQNPNIFFPEIGISLAMAFPFFLLFFNIPAVFIFQNSCFFSVCSAFKFFYSHSLPLHLFKFRKHHFYFNLPLCIKAGFFCWDTLTIVFPVWLFELC